MAFIPLAIAALTIAATPAPASRAPASASDGTSLSPAYYDARYKVVVVPYTGPVPTYTQGAVDKPPRVFLDFKARFSGGYPAGVSTGHPQLLRYAMAPRGAGTTRLTLTFREPTKVRVMHNAKRHLLVLVPQPSAKAAAASPAPAKPTPAPAATPKPRTSAFPETAASIAPGQSGTLGSPRYDAARRTLVIPYTGPMPAHISEALVGPPRVYFDFEAAYSLRNAPGGATPGHPTLQRWAISPRDRDTTRLTLTFTQPTRVLLRADEARHELWLIPQDTAAAPTTAPSARPTAVPAARPTVIPSPQRSAPDTAPTLPPPQLAPSEKPTPFNSP